MTPELYSVDQVASLLGLHVKTVRNYVREGRLNAVRIGKQYRIARADLEALAGKPAAALEPEPVRRVRHVEVSAIVQVDAIPPEGVGRVTNLLLGSVKGRPAGDQPIRIETIHDQERARLKIILIGGVDTTAGLLKLIHAILEP